MGVGVGWGGDGDRVKIFVGLFHFISVFVLSFFFHNFL